MSDGAAVAGGSWWSSLLDKAVNTAGQVALARDANRTAVQVAKANNPTPTAAPQSFQLPDWLKPASSTAQTVAAQVQDTRLDGLIMPLMLIAGAVLLFRVAK